MIAVAFALEFESAYFQAKHDRRLRLSVWLLGAMGVSAADVVEKKLQQMRPTLLISAGFAGALQPGLDVGDMALGRNYCDPDLLARLQIPAHWHVGDLLTVPAILEHSAEKRRLGRAHGAMIADMETAAISEICRREGVPLLSVRSISDALEDDMPVPARFLLNPKTGRPEPLQLFRHLVANPSVIPAFNKLVKNARQAQRSLAFGLEELLPQLLHLA